MYVETKNESGDLLISVKGVNLFGIVTSESVMSDDGLRSTRFAYRVFDARTAQTSRVSFGNGTDLKKIKSRIHSTLYRTLSKKEQRAVQDARVAQLAGQVEAEKTGSVPTLDPDTNKARLLKGHIPFRNASQRRDRRGRFAPAPVNTVGTWISPAPTLSNTVKKMSRLAGFDLVTL